MNTTCLNCESEIVGKYCHNCGQPASTHRLSFKHFLAHDLVHGIFHLDKGILFTLKHVMFRPGFMVNEYLAGKRSGHFNIATLLLLLVGLFLYVVSLKHLPLPALKVNGENGTTLVQFVVHYSKWFLLLLIPISAKATKDIFSKLNYNGTEYIVLNAFFFSGVFFIMLLFIGLYFIPTLNNAYILLVEVAAIVCYLIRAFRQVTFSIYTKGAFVMRMCLYFICLLAYLSGIIAAILAIYLFCVRYLGVH